MNNHRDNRRSGLALFFFLLILIVVMLYSMSDFTLLKALGKYLRHVDRQHKQRWERVVIPATAATRSQE